MAVIAQLQKGPTNILPITTADAVGMPDGSGSLTKRLQEIEKKIPANPGGTAPSGAVTKEAVEAVLTGDIKSHNHKTEVDAAIRSVENKIPTKSSQLQNDSNYVVDANYHHTDNNFTTEEKRKLAGLQPGSGGTVVPGQSIREIEVTEGTDLPLDPNIVLQMQLVDDPSEALGTYTKEQLDTKLGNYGTRIENLEKAKVQGEEVAVLNSASEEVNPKAKVVFTLEDSLPDGVLLKDMIRSSPTQVTVGATGTFNTLGEALRELSKYNILYKQGGIECSVTIQRGTIIKEQIFVRGIDLSYITIYYEGHKTTTNADSIISNYAGVLGTCKVDATGWVGVTHDTRGDVCLFHAEDGARLPQVACIFELQNSGGQHVCGMMCNKGSWGLVASGCGFVKFWDGVIANNESSITIREGITSHCNRWGCHARHNGEVSARSVIAVGCGIDSEGAGVCADRVANLDARKAYISANANSIKCFNCSMLNANEIFLKGSGQATISATGIGIINALKASGTNLHFVVQTGGQIACAGSTGKITYSKNTNQIDGNGIIFT